MRLGVFTAVLHKEEAIYVAECTQVGTMNQGTTIEEAVANLREATELYLEAFLPKEVEPPFVTVFEVNLP